MKLRFLAIGTTAVLTMAGIGPIAFEAGAGAATTAGRPVAGQLRQLLAADGLHGSLRSLLREGGLVRRPSSRGSSAEVVTPSPWSTVPTPTFGGGGTATFGSVSCGAATDCVAVGSDTTSSAVRPIAAVFHGGTWTATAVPVPTASPDSDLSSVSCPSATFCLAVGGQSSTTTSTVTLTTAATSLTTDEAPLVEQWNGQTWSIVTPPTTGRSVLTSVSCTSPSSCTTVGDTASDTSGTLGVTAVVAQWNGSTWSVTQLPSPATTLRLATAVSCTSPIFCMAGGWQADSGNQTIGMFALEWNGSSWTATTVATLGPTQYVLVNAISCATPTLCMAAGEQLSTAGLTTVVEQWNGSTWSAAKTPSPAVASVLTAVDCFGPTSCVAGGATTTPDPSATTATTTGTVQPLVLNWDGTTWAQATVPHWTPNGSGGSDVAVEGIGCFPGVQCVAVGQNGPAAFSMTAPATRSGYDEVASDGGLFAFGTAFYGSMGGKPLNQPIVGMAMSPDGGGYWEVAADGGIFAFGDAAFYGSMGGQPLNKPIVGMAPTPDGRGYYEVASDGGLFAFGDATFDGSMGGQPLNQPVVGLAVAPTGGYYEVASDGGLFAFGNAPFQGSMGGQPLNKPIVSMAATPSGGYYEVASDGGLFAFGAPFRGSMGGQPLNKPIVGMTVAPNGGYYEVASDGGLFAFGNAPFQGSMGGQPLNKPVVGMAQ